MLGCSSKGDRGWGEEEREKGRGKEVFAQRVKELPLEIGEVDVAHKQMEAILV